MKLMTGPWMLSWQWFAVIEFVVYYSIFDCCLRRLCSHCSSCQLSIIVKVQYAPLKCRAWYRTLHFPAELSHRCHSSEWRQWHHSAWYYARQRIISGNDVSVSRLTALKCCVAWCMWVIVIIIVIVTSSSSSAALMEVGYCYYTRRRRSRSR